MLQWAIPVAASAFGDAGAFKCGAVSSHDLLQSPGQRFAILSFLDNVPRRLIIHAHKEAYDYYE